jgi:hypothetical protein
MKWVKEYMDIRYNKHLKNWDTVVGIVGAEGVSKSNLAMHKLDYWKTKTKGKCKESDVKHMNMTGEDFVNDLSDAEKMDCPCFDEAGELDSRRAMSNFNVMLSQGYKVIRSDKLYTILVLPDIWDLEFRFVKRMKALFVVYRRGHVAVWLKESLVKMAQLNSFRRVKSYWAVRPDFYDTFPIYKGPMAKKYEIKKEEKTKEARKNLKELLNGDKKKVGVTPQDIAKNMQALGYNNTDIAASIMVDNSTVGKWFKKGRNGGK